MSEWKKVRILEQQIEYCSEKAILIKMPHSSNYKGCTFWYSKKLIKKDGKSYTMSFTDDFSFRILKGREIVDEIGAAEIEDAFPAIASPYETYKPKKKDAVKVDIPKDLIDNQ